MESFGLTFPVKPDMGLAPMEGVTGISTRLWFALTSQPRGMSTPFLRATESFPHRRLPADYAPELVTHSNAPYHLMPQVMAANAADFLRAARFIPESSSVELNAGCPAPHSFGGGAGSALLKHPENFRQMLLRIIDHLGPHRLALKMRLGIDNGDKEFPTLIEKIQDLPLLRLTIHARTRNERYLGKSRHNLTHWASTQTSTPVYASGDILDFKSLEALKAKAPYIRGVLIGRGALRNPWIFSTLKSGFAGTAISVEDLLGSLKCLYLLERWSMISSHFLNHSALTDFMFILCQKIWSYVSPALDQKNPTQPIEGVSINQSDTNWQLLYAELFALGQNAGLDNLAAVPERLEKHLLGRMKMFWNYLRSSVVPFSAIDHLPDQPQGDQLQDALLDHHPPNLQITQLALEIMREKTLASFWHSLRLFLESCQQSSSTTKLHLGYYPDWDWVYSGGGRNSLEQ